MVRLELKRWAPREREWRCGAARTEKVGWVGERHCGAAPLEMAPSEMVHRSIQLVLAIGSIVGRSSRVVGRGVAWSGRRAHGRSDGRVVGRTVAWVRSGGVS